jgi:transposase InsO family protein
VDGDDGPIVLLDLLLQQSQAGANGMSKSCSMLKGSISWEAPGNIPDPIISAERNVVISRLKDLGEQGPTTGVPTLREDPDFTRAELADLVVRYRHVYRERNAELLHVLKWQVPGRVWAMDFAEPSLRDAPRSLPPIDGLYPYLLAVRDLASGCTLAWLPVCEATAETVQRLLHDLFRIFGAPLVLKSDNGGHFRADCLRAFLADAGVEQLFSPPHFPRYNGSIEATIGSLKTRTEQHAAALGRPAIWTTADVNAARLLANKAIDPKRRRAPTPDETWALRSAISPTNAIAFA